MTQPPGAPELTQRHSGLRRCPKPQMQGGVGSEFLPGGRAQACLPLGWAALGLRWGPVLASVSCAAAQWLHRIQQTPVMWGRELGLSLGLSLLA